EGFVKVLRKMFRNPVSIAGITLVLLFIFIAIFAPLLARPEYPWNPYMMPQSGLSAVPQPPSPQHIFGTTQGQYGIYYGVIWGTRTAITVGVVVIGLALIIGIFIGTIAAYF
ncbi:MAG: ABC transporter permease, partial [Athalassotoga sp.]